MRPVEIDGVTLMTVWAGTGPRLLALPGTAADLRNPTSFQNSALVEHFEVLTFDPRGLGLSDKPDQAYSMAGYAADAAGVMDAYGWDRAHVLGNSFGGMTAQELAIREPERIDRLVLVSCATGGAGGSSYPIEEFEELEPYEKARRSMMVGDTAFNEAWIAANPEQADARIRQTMERQARNAAEPGRAIGRRRQLAARAEHDTYDRVGKIRARTMVLAGDHDGQAPVSYQRTLADRIPGAEFRLIEGSHGVLYQNPAAPGIVREFLNQRDFVAAH